MPCLCLPEELQQCQVGARPVSRSRRGCYREPSCLAPHAPTAGAARPASATAFPACLAAPPAGLPPTDSGCSRRHFEPGRGGQLGSPPWMQVSSERTQRGSGRVSPPGSLPCRELGPVRERVPGAGQALNRFPRERGSGQSLAALPAWLCTAQAAPGLTRWSPSRRSWRHRGSYLPDTVEASHVISAVEEINLLWRLRMVGWKGPCRSACSNSAALGTSRQSSLRGAPSSLSLRTSGDGVPTALGLTTLSEKNVFPTSNLN